MASSRLKPVLPEQRTIRRTGFSREGVSRLTAKLMLHIPASSRLKPVLP